MHPPVPRPATATLSDAQLLAQLLTRGSPRQPTVERALHEAERLIAESGGLRELVRDLTGEPPRLAAVTCHRRKAGHRREAGHRRRDTANRALLQAALELARRHYAAALRAGAPLSSPADTRRFLIAQLRDRPSEVFCCLYLDNRHRLIEFEELFRGTIDGAAVHPREVLRRALEHNAAAVILAHNHPSGIAEPSRADELITLRLRDALALVDIRVLDHFIVAGPEALSLAERGLL